MSSRACPAGAPAVTSLRPSRLATRVAGAAVGSPGTVIPASGAGPLLADAALTPSVPNAATAARPAPIPRARRRFVLLIMLIVLPGICGRCLVARPPWSCTQRSGPAPQPGTAGKLTAIWVNRIKAAYVARRAITEAMQRLLAGNPLDHRAVSTYSRPQRGRPETQQAHPQAHRPQGPLQ